MGSAIKSILIGFAVLLGVAVLAITIAVATFDPNDYKADIEQAVKENTGREFSIEGELSLSVFPWLAVELPKVTLANREGFGDAPMFNVNSASLALKIMPLFAGTLEVGEIQIDGAEINLEIKPDGTNNWDDMIAAMEAAAADEPDGVDVDVTFEDDSVPTRDGEVGSFQVAGVQITNTAIRYIDAPGEASFILEDFRFVTGAIKSGADVSLDGGFRFATEPAALAGAIEFDGKVLSLGQNDRVSIEDLGIRGELSGDDVGNVPVSFAAARIDVGTLDGTLALDELSAQFAELVVKGSITGKNLDTDPELAGSIEVPNFSARELMQALEIPPPEMASATALSKVGVKAAFAMTPDVITLSDARIVLDDTTFNGRFAIRSGARSAYEFELAGDQIVVDDYLAPATDDGGDASGEASVDDTEIPVELLREMDAKGSITLQRAELSGMAFTDIEFGLNLAGGALRLHPLKAGLFDGSYAGDIRIDASADTPRLSLNEAVTGVQLEPLFRTMFETENLSGTIEGRFQLAGNGTNLGAIRQTLGGDIAFSLADGALEGTDLWYQIRRAKALFDQEAPPAPPANPRTPFSEINATAKVAGGVLTNDDFSAVLPFLQLTGAGKLNLVASTVDYRMDARVLERPDFIDATAEELDQYTEAVIPIKISGSLAEPSIAPDIAGLAKARVQQEIDKKKDELRDKLLDKLGIDNTAAANDPNAAGETAAAEDLDAEDLLKQKAGEALLDLLDKKKK
ncbi:MAG: AsmA family protein [Pseudomonadota bacterium]